MQYGGRSDGRASEMVHREGFITKRGRIRRNWLRRWFVLSGDRLEYRSEPGGRVKGVLRLQRDTLVRMCDATRLEPRCHTLALTDSLDPFAGLEGPAPATKPLDFEVLSPFVCVCFCVTDADVCAACYGCRPLRRARHS
jgi:hypothetical protein